MKKILLCVKWLILHKQALSIYLSSTRKRLVLTVRDYILGCYLLILENIVRNLLVISVWWCDRNLLWILNPARIPISDICLISARSHMGGQELISKFPFRYMHIFLYFIIIGPCWNSIGKRPKWTFREGFSATVSLIAGQEPVANSISGGRRDVARFEFNLRTSV